MFCNNRYWLWLLLAAFFVGVACPLSARKKPRKIVPEQTKELLNSNDRRRFDYFFMQAVCMQEKDDYASAYDLLRHCLEINPNAAEVYFTLANYDDALHQDSITLKHLRKAVELSPENDAYAERLGQVYIKLQEYDQAIQLFERISAASGSRTDVLGLLCRLYQQKKDYPMLIKTLNRLEDLEGSSDDISLSKMQVYSLQGDKKAEFRELKSLAQKHPNDYNYRVMMGNWLLKNDKPKEALAEYNAVLKKEPDNYSAQVSMLDYYKSQGQDSLAKALTETLLISNKTPVETKRQLVSQFIMETEENNSDSTLVLNLFDQILSTPQNDPEMASWKAVYVKLKNMPEEKQMGAWEQVLNIDPSDKSARLEMLQLAIRKQDFRQAVDICRHGAEYTPDEMIFYYYLGLSHFQLDEKEDALLAFRQGVSQINSDSNPEIVSDFYAIMGDILHEKQLDNEAFAAYDSCLQWKADNIGCLNNYAYYLSLKDKDLARAEKMSSQTVKAEPDNPTFLDTYAWILFRQGRFEEAKIYIDQALKNDSVPSAVIIEHAGDIYAQAGYTDLAVEFWEKALDMGGDSMILNRKLKLRKYVE